MELNSHQIVRLFPFLLTAMISNTIPMSISESILVMNFLIRMDIPFDATFEPVTRKEAAKLQLTIHVSPQITITIQL